MPSRARYEMPSSQPTTRKRFNERADGACAFGDGAPITRKYANAVESRAASGLRIDLVSPVHVKIPNGKVLSATPSAAMEGTHHLFHGEPQAEDPIEADPQP